MVSFNLHEVPDWLKMILRFWRLIVIVVLKTAYSIEWLEFFILISYLKKKIKTRKCNILVLPVKFMNELYIYVYFFLFFKLFRIKR